MRRIQLVYVSTLGLLLQSSALPGETPLDSLEQDINEAKQQHQDAVSGIVTNFLSQLDTASRTPEAAIALYQQAGGSMPDPTPVVTQYENETPTEKEARQAQDKENLAQLAYILQAHCGLMRFGGLFVVKSDQKGLQDDWIAWLKATAQIYPQLQSGGQSSAPPDAGGEHHHHVAGQGTDMVGDWRRKPLRDSLISKFLGFQSWGDKEQGGWCVRDVPKLYRSQVLDPLRATPTADTLAAWDIYIAMKGADQKDPDRWIQVEQPALLFERGSDDFSMTPNADKLAPLVAIIKANPTHPQIDDWLSRIKQMLQTCRDRQAAANAPAPVAAAPTTSGVTVTTTVQGDMTIITTHNTNSASNPAPPAPADPNSPNPPPPDQMAPAPAPAAVSTPSPSTPVTNASPVTATGQ